MTGDKEVCVGCWWHYHKRWILKWQQCQSSSLLWNEVPKNTASKRQGKVDFLSFNVTDKSSPKLSSELSRPVASGGTGDSVKKIQEQDIAKWTGLSLHKRILTWQVLDKYNSWWGCFNCFALYFFLWFFSAFLHCSLRCVL